ncbi:MAG TPA: hypothetical protein VGR73_10870 [Bryobacteraceae bacterium]|nr:hypothetical protein [Bryobacteraceae bacterium]
MTLTATVPVAHSPEIIPLTNRNAIQDAPTQAPPVCVFLAATGAHPVGEIARRMATALGPMALDITGFAEPQALRHLRGGNAAFLVLSTDWLCLELAQEWSRWLRSHGLEERCGLALWHVPGGATAEQAEDLTGLPVCALLKRDAHIEEFANWIAAEYQRTTAAC